MPPAMNTGSSLPLTRNTRGPPRRLLLVFWHARVRPVVAYH